MSSRVPVKHGQRDRAEKLLLLGRSVVQFVASGDLQLPLLVAIENIVHCCSQRDSERQVPVGVGDFDPWDKV